MSCKYCEPYNTNDIPIHTNVDNLRNLALIAISDDNIQELILCIDNKAYGIRLNYCPVCGEQLRDKPLYIIE